MSMIFMSLSLTPMFKFSSMLITEMMLLMCLLSLKYMYISWEMVPYFLSCNLFVDKISSILAIMSIWISSLMIQSILSFPEKQKMLKFMIILLMNVLILLFMVTKLIMFFVFFELSLIPTLYMIIGWGAQPERIKAGMYLMMYTLIFSLPFFSFLMFINFTYGYPSIPLITMNSYSYQFSKTFTLIILLMFLVKIPMFFLHFWLPKAHVEAPVCGSMILAGLLLKMGGYGLIRMLPVLNSKLVIQFFCSLSLVGMVAICLLCLMSTDLKVIIAYSSVNHMNFMIIGLMMMTTCSVSGGLLLMVSHGLISSGMFFLGDVSYKRFHTRSLYIHKSLSIVQPVMNLWWFIFTLLNMGFPPSLSSFSEIILSISLLGSYPYATLYIMMYLLLSALYSMYLFYMLNHGTSNSVTQLFKSFSVKEMLILFIHMYPAVLMIFNISLMIF
uniref:NADH dehydrogenase subunit 4 n=1 Tax=Menacanthus cornutus TaxID=1491751 RepID=UPI0020008CCE|nr:NADH dehydrogenase subunit 4 [Menacanthus cornutus]UNZ12999.1 NADH dehydrogenase subunit 4 [Menacanthus cornutus]